MKRNPLRRLLRMTLLQMTSVAILVVLLLFRATLWAQNPFDDFGAPAVAQEQVPGADADTSPVDVAGQNPPAPVAPAAAVEPPPDPSQYSLPIRAVLESDPQTPVQLIRAASVLIDLEQPTLARPYVAKLQQAALDDASLVDLVKQLGSRPFLNIAGEKALEPAGREFADRAIAAASHAARDPARLAQLVEQLGAASVAEQRGAMAALVDAHEYAAPLLLAALNDPARKAVHARSRDALVALGQDAVAPLLAVLDGPDSNAKVAAIQALGRIGASQATGRLVGLYASPQTSNDVRNAAGQTIADLHGTTPKAGEASAYLVREVRALLFGERRPQPLLGGRAEVWVWDAVKEQPVPQSLSAEQARSQLALQLARRLYELSPEHREFRQLYLVSLLAAEAHRVGRDNPLPRDENSVFATAVALGAASVEDALSFALEHDHPAAATVAAELLGEIGKAEQLSRGAEPAPLAQSLTHEDRRLRFAAAQAIVKLMPVGHFAGASHLASALVSFATSSGERRALVGFPNAETATNLAGLVGSLGFETAVATNGRELLLKATQARTHDLILVSSRIDRAPLYLVLQDLRNHTATAQTPIIVLAEDDERGVLRERLEDDPLTSVVLRPRSLEGMQYAADAALRRAGDRIVAPAVRERQAAEALKSMAALSAAAPKVFSFRDFQQELLPLLYLPALGPLAADVVDDFGTHASQQALLAIVNRTSQPLASRQAAAVAFGESVRRFGVRLTRNEILRQYDRYNASEFEDGATQELLGAVLDAIEFRAKAGLNAPANGE